jgi:hypothetical protein
MDSVKLIILADILGGLVIFGVSLPLVFRKAAMNDLYGFRIRAAFESEQRWYDINAYGGRQTAAWSWLLIGSGVAGFFIPPGAGTAYLIANGALTVVAVMVPVILVNRWSRRH